MIELRNAPMDILDNEEDIIQGIGSEHCSIKFQREAEAFLNSEYINTHSFRLVTPKTDQNHIFKVIQLIEKILRMQKLDSIVVNDLGVLNYLKDKAVNITLGRILAGSFGYRANVKPIIHPDENPDIIVNMLAPSILHQRKVDLFKKYGVSAVEVCAMHYEEEYHQILQKYGLKIHMHYGSFVAGVSKVCYNKKANDLDVACCSISCLYPQKLNLAHFAPISGAPVSNELLKEKQKDWPNFYLSGNIIYYINTDKPVNFRQYNTIIYDYRYCNYKSI